MQVVKRTIQQDIQQSLIQKGLTELESKVISARLNSIDEMNSFLDVYINKSFPSMDNPMNLMDMEKAVLRIIVAIEKNESIAIACDYDTDGLGAASVLKLGLESMGVDPSKLSILISERYKGGYGFSDNIVDRVLSMKNKPDVIITVDEGSSDHKRIKRLKQESPDIDVIVTDHHHVPKQEPDLAHAFVNPNRPGDQFKHKDICGAVVAFFVIQALNNIRASELKIDLKPLLDIAAISTVGDMMPLTDPLNRAILLFALKRANTPEKQPLFWKIFIEEDDKARGLITEETIGFTISPRINSMSRIGADAMAVVNYFTSNDALLVSNSLHAMSDTNEERKELDSVLYEESVEQMLEQKNDFTTLVHLPRGKSGVTGIVASRIKVETGRPVICFCPKTDSNGLITGSGRSAGDIDIRFAIEAISEEFEELRNGMYGGHPAACGLTIKAEDFSRFKQLFEAQIAKQSNGIKLKPFLDYDFEIGKDINMNFGLVHQIESIGPFGQLFPKPNVLVEGIIVSKKLLNGGHLKGTIAVQGEEVDFIWFAKSVGQNDTSVFKEGVTVNIIGKASINEFMGNQTLQILTEHLEVA